MKVKAYFETKVPCCHSMLETYKPILALSTVQESSMQCDNMAMMEQVIMESQTNEEENKWAGEHGLPGGSRQHPYKVQADQLVSYIDNMGKKQERG
jgi:hypothetical protein